MSKMEELVCVKLPNACRLPVLGFSSEVPDDKKLKYKQSDTLDGVLQAGYRHVQFDSRYADTDVVTTLKAWVPDKLARDDVFISVKVSVDNVGLRKVNVRSNVLRSLQNLSLEYIDMVMLDFTTIDEQNEILGSDKFVTMTTHKRAVECMSSLVSEGKCRSWGIVHDDITMLNNLLAEVKVKPATLQITVGPHDPAFVRFRKYCQYKQLPLVVELPHKMSHKQEHFEFFKNVEAIADQKHKSQQQILARLCLSYGVAVLCVSSTVQHAKLNFQVLDFGLSNEDIQRLQIR